MKIKTKRVRDQQSEIVWMNDCKARLSIFDTLSFPEGFTIGKHVQDLTLKDCSLYETQYLVMENSKLLYMAIPKSLSSSTKLYLASLGKSLGDPFTYRMITHTATCGCSQYPNISQLEDFFATTKNKTVFTIIRSVPERVDAAAGTVLNRMQQLIVGNEGLQTNLNLTFEHVVKVYNSWHETVDDAVTVQKWDSGGLRPLHHLLPQVFFLNNIPADILVLLADKNIGRKVKNLVRRMYVDAPGDLPTYPVANRNEGGITISFWDYLQNHPKFAQSYAYDARLIELARQQGC